MPAHLIAEEGPLKGLVLSLEEGNDWIIGRDKGTSQLVIEDATVSRKHVHLYRRDEGIYLENLSQVNPTLINDEEHDQPILLKEGDRIFLGSSMFVFSEKQLPKTTGKKGKSKPKGYDDIFSDLDDVGQEETVQGGALPPPKEEVLPPEKEVEEESPEPTVYDTIFEDAGSEEELPFNLLSETPLLLKVISGPNAGAEIGMEKGRVYTLGKDQNTCDIVFQDLSVSRNHARLTVTPDGALQIEDLGSKNGTVVNGNLITEKKEITPQDLIAMGTTVFLIIDREAPQETIYSQILPSYETKPASSPSAEELVKGEMELKVPKDWKKQPIPTKHLISAVAFAAVFLIAFLSFFSLFKSKGTELARKEPVSEIKDALEKYPAVQFSFNPSSGKLFLVGHVATSVDYQEMRYRIDGIGFITSTEDTVVIDETVAKMMNDILATTPAWRGTSIRVISPGKFGAVGFIQTNPEAADLSEYLTVNFPYLDRLENQVVVIDNLNAQLQSMLASHGFGAVGLQLNYGEVILTGVYNEQLKTEYDDLLKKIRSVPGVHGVKSFALATEPNQAAIDISQQYRVSGSTLYDGRGYSAVLNGKMYTLGDQLNGMKITAIESNTILLEKDGVKYKIGYTL